MVEGCQEVLGESAILVAHNAKEGDVYWQKNGSGNRIVSSGVLRWEPIPTNRQCGWTNHFCTAICMKCARRLGYVW